MTRKLAFAAMLAALAGCADNSARFLIDPPAPAAKVSVRVSTVEVRNVTLPGYAAALEIAQQESGGALRQVPKTLWADDPVHGVTTALARSLDDAASATVAAEPWPLDNPAQARVEVRVERMLAGASGQFEFAGQYAVSSPDGIIRERLERFAISVPLAGATPADIATATSQGIAELAGRIARTLAR